MPEVVGVRFREAGRIYYFDPAGFENLKVGTYIVVDTARGEDIGQVVIVPKQMANDKVVGQLKGILRRAEPWDLLRMQHFRNREKQALEKCRQKIAEYGLPMKVIKAEYNYDGSLLVFHFTAEKRVDFRKLVKELARTFRSRIELKQIGVRDEAKMIGDLGCCGRPLCCASFLCEFNPVSIRMAKLQDLPLSPMEISGICGRLLCCLVYENDYYAEVKNRLPKVGDVIVTPHGPGKVIGINALRETLNVELDNEATIEIPAEELKTDKKPTGRRRRGRRRRR
jgi:cell fate regulator YaaT (PSP1 superfamily)